MSEITSARRMAEHQLLELRELVAAESQQQGSEKTQQLVEEQGRHQLQPVRLPAWEARLAWAAPAFQA